MKRLTILAAVLAAMMTLGIGHAKKPDHAGGGSGGGNDAPQGVIYFLHGTQIKSMSADGSGKTALALPYWGLPFEPSHAEHGGGRWYLYTAFDALAVIKDDGTNVLLNAPGDDGDWEVAFGGGVRWVFDLEAALAGFDGTDGLVSWYALRWNNGEIVDSAVCVAPLLFNPETGNIDGIDLGSVVRIHDVSPDYDWSPDGTEMVFSLHTEWQQGKLWLYDTFDGSFALLPAENGINPVWSPNGASIAYADRSDLIDYIVVLHLDGMSQTTVATARRRNALEGTYLYTPHWSPQSSHLLYVKGNTKGYNEEYHVWRAGADGKNAVKLTGDLESTWDGVNILGWR